MTEPGTVAHFQQAFAQAAKALIRNTGGCLFCQGRTSRCPACLGRARERKLSLLATPPKDDQ